MAMLYVLSAKLSIFSAQILVCQGKRPPLVANMGILAFISLPKSVMTSVCWARNSTGYEIQETYCKFLKFVIHDMQIAEITTSFL